MYLTELKNCRKGRLCRAMSRPSAGPSGRAGVWARFIIALALSFIAFGTRTPATLAWLTGADMLFLLCSRPGVSFLRKAAKAMLWQAGILSGLYGLRFGFAEGCVPGLTVSWQLCLAFLPGAVFAETTPGHRIVRMLSDAMPYRLAFIMAACLHFIPLLLREIRGIYEGQVLRGAKILPKDLINPLNWRDVLHCLAVPAIIHSMNLASEIAIAAKARDFGVLPDRTFWPEEQEP